VTTTPPLRPRWIAQHVLDALEDTPVVAIVGPRQAGKSTLVASITAERPGWTSWTLDDLNILERALADPAGLIAETRGPVAIDEVQRAPKLLLAIKAAVDRDRRPGRFLLTGSADVFALPRYGDALTGRVEVAPLRPFSQGELEGIREDFVRWAFGTERPPTPPPLEDLAERVLRGGFPPAVARATARRRRAWFDAYLATSLQRDVHDVAQLERLGDLPRLVRLLAARTARPVNVAELSRTSGLPATTLSRYLHALRALFLIEEVPAWSTNAGKRLARRPKLLMSDTGLAAALLDVTKERWTTSVEARGALVETFVALELRKQLAWSAVSATLHHYREHDGTEVDLVLEAADGRVVGVEVKAGHRLGDDAPRHLARLRDAVGHRFVRGIVLYGGPTVVPLGDRLWALPISALWARAP
jgi:predicted AAA+ superfamily ATPase